MIEVVDVTQHYGVRPILRDVSIRVERGEIVAVMGPNWVGKTTLLRVMAGVLAPQKGHVAIDGRRRRSTPEDEREVRKRVVYLTDRPWLPMMPSGRDFLLAVGRLYSIEDERLFDHVERLFKLFNLADQADAAISTYSAGQQKKIALAAALVTEAPVMILDEPFSGGLDPAGILALKKVLQSLSERGRATVVLATPVPELMEPLAHKIAVLDRGTIAAQPGSMAPRRMPPDQGRDASARHEPGHLHGRENAMSVQAVPVARPIPTGKRCDG